MRARVAPLSLNTLECCRYSPGILFPLTQYDVWAAVLGILRRADHFVAEPWVSIEDHW